MRHITAEEAPGLLVYMLDQPRPEGLADGQISVYSAALVFASIDPALAINEIARFLGLRADSVRKTIAAVVWKQKLAAAIRAGRPNIGRYTQKDAR